MGPWLDRISVFIRRDTGEVAFSPSPISLAHSLSPPPFPPSALLPLPLLLLLSFLIFIYLFGCWTSLVAQMAKHLPIMWETRVLSLSWEDLLEKEMATHCSILAWKMPWTEEPGGLQSMGSQRVGHDWVTSLYLAVLDLSCSMWELVPWPGIKSKPPALGAES